MLLPVSRFRSVDVCFIYLGTLILTAYIFIIIIFSQWSDPLSLYNILVSCDSFSLKVYSGLMDLFPFTTLKDVIHCHLACKVSDKKSTLINIFIPLYVMWLFFFGCLQDFHFIFGFQKFEYDMPR